MKANTNEAVYLRDVRAWHVFPSRSNPCHQQDVREQIELPHAFLVTMFVDTLIVLVFRFPYPYVTQNMFVA